MRKQLITFFDKTLWKIHLSRRSKVQELLTLLNINYRRVDSLLEELKRKDHKEMRVLMRRNAELAIAVDMYEALHGDGKIDRKLLVKESLQELSSLQAKHYEEARVDKEAE